MVRDERYCCSPYLLKKCRSLSDARQQIGQAHGQTQGQTNLSCAARRLADARAPNARPNPKALSRPAPRAGRPARRA